MSTPSPTTRALVDLLRLRKPECADDAQRIIADGEKDDLEDPIAGAAALFAEIAEEAGNIADGSAIWGTRPIEQLDQVVILGVRVAYMALYGAWHARERMRGAR